MNIGYRLLYRLGITPWDGQPVPGELKALVEGPRAVPPARALDLGCGTGRNAVYLARHGWEVTAVDYTPQAVRAAGERARAEGVEVRFLDGDVTRLEGLGLGAGYDLILDAGCFHGLPRPARAAYARGVARVRNPGAILLMLAFQPGWRGPAPRGASAEEIAETFEPAWRVASSAAATGMRLPGPLRSAGPTWYRLEAAA